MLAIPAATDDGVNPDGTLNLNSGAVSTIFGLLTTEALDANPDIAAIALASAHVEFRDGQQTIEAEAASLAGPAAVVPANPVNTGESQWSGGAYVQLATGSAPSWAAGGQGAGQGAAGPARGLTRRSLQSECQ